jgi:hypothetical protein
VGELRPHVKAVEKYINKSLDSATLWTKLRTAFDQLVKECEQDLHYIAERKMWIRWKKEAWTSVVNVAKDVEKDRAILTMLGYGHFLRDQPKRIASDVGGFVQCARAWRRLSDVNVAEYWDGKEGRRKRVYRDGSHRGSIMLGQLLVEKLAHYGASIHSRIEAERQRAQELKQGIRDAIAVSGEQPRI